MPIAPMSVQLYTVREAISLDLRDALERIRDLGFTTVELYGFVERSDEYASLLAEFGLSAPTAHAHLVGENAEPIFAAAKAIGVTTLIDPMIPAERWSTEADIAASATSLGEIAAAAAEHGIRVGYHNHWWELESRIDGVPALEVFASFLDEAVVLEVDTYWAEVGGVSAAALLQRLGERVTAIHVKDGAVNRDDQEQVAVGNGRMPVLDILAAAPGALRVVELDGFAGDVFEALADSRAYLIASGAAS